MPQLPSRLAIAGIFLAGVLSAWPAVAETTGALPGASSGVPPVSTPVPAPGALPSAPAGAASPIIENEEYGVAVFGGLDKVTAKVTRFDAAIDQPVDYGTLQLTVRSCHKKPPEETPQTSTYVEIREHDIDHPESVGVTPIFKGWMFAESPALHALEHPVYDVWLIDCKMPSPSTPVTGNP